MKAIVRFIFVLALVCGAAFAWKAIDRKSRRFQLAEEAVARPRDEADPLQEALEPLHSARTAVKAESLWSKTDFQNKLEDAFQKNDPCAVVELLRSPRDVAPREVWAAAFSVLLGQARERSPLLEELLASPESPLYGFPQENTKRRETRFLNALVYAGQLREQNETEDQPRRHPQRNVEKAIEVFRGLAQEDGDNGANAFFLATALKQNGAKKEEVQNAFSQAARAQRFDPVYQGVFDELQKAAYSNAATFSLAYLFLENMPVPDYNFPVRHLKWWAHNDEAGKWIAQRIAKKMIELGAAYKQGSPGYLYSHSEYIIGHNLRYTVDGRMEKNWQEYTQRMREAEEFISEAPQPVRDAEVSLYRDKLETKKSCGPEAWKSLFSAYRAKAEGRK